MLLLSEDALMALGAVLGFQARAALLREPRDARIAPHLSELPA